MNYFKITPVYLIVIPILLLSGCRSGSSTNNKNTTDNLPLTKVTPSDPANLDANLYEIIISPQDARIYVPLQYSAIGKYDDGTTADLTNLVDWSTITAGVATINDSGLATPKTIEETKVSASYKGITSEQVTLNVVESKVCGHNIEQENILSKEPQGGINDTDRNNSAGKCLKLIEIVDSADDKTKWFVSPASKTFADSLNYTSADRADNSGMTYASINDEYVTFRQDGVDVNSTDDINGQADRWCKKLESIEFAGKSNWRRATVYEINAMINYETDNSSLYDRFGWPISTHYWSSSKYMSDKYYYINPSSPVAGAGLLNSAYFTPCVSVQ